MEEAKFFCGGRQFEVLDNLALRHAGAIRIFTVIVIDGDATVEGA